MTDFTTTSEQQIEVHRIATKMSEEGISAAFIAHVVQFACVYEGAFELMQLWIDSANAKDRDGAIADLQDGVQRFKERS